jgi:hypothetical protein
MVGDRRARHPGADVAWKISELKEAVRRGLREDREKS